MKILFAVPHYSFNIQGAIRPLLKDLSKGLSERGHKADVISLYIDEFWYPQWKKETFFDEGVKVTRLPSINPVPLRKGEKSNVLNFINCGAIPSPGFRRIVKEYDILNFFDMIDLTFPFFSLFLKVPKIHCCITLTEQFTFYMKHPLWRYVLSKTSDYYLTSTKHSLGLLHQLGIPEDKSDYLYHGVNTELFKPSEIERGKNTILFLSRIEPRKGLNILVEAMSLVKNPSILLIAGQAADDEYFKIVMKKAERENEKGFHKIEYIGIPSDEEKIKLFQSVSLFVLPSIFEDYGIVNLEALACETPVISTKVGGVPEVVRDGENGYVVNPGNVKDLAYAIDKLLENEDLRRQMGKKGREIVIKDFSWKKILDRLEVIYHNLISKRRV